MSWGAITVVFSLLCAHLCSSAPTEVLTIAQIRPVKTVVTKPDASLTKALPERQWYVGSVEKEDSRNNPLTPASMKFNEFAPHAAVGEEVLRTFLKENLEHPEKFKTDDHAFFWHDLVAAQLEILSKSQRLSKGEPLPNGHVQRKGGFVSPLKDYVADIARRNEMPARTLRDFITSQFDSENHPLAKKFEESLSRDLKFTHETPRERNQFYALEGLYEKFLAWFKTLKPKDLKSSPYSQLEFHLELLRNIKQGSLKIDAQYLLQQDLYRLQPVKDTAVGGLEAGGILTLENFKQSVLMEKMKLPASEVASFDQWLRKVHPQRGEIADEKLYRKSQLIHHYVHWVDQTPTNDFLSKKLAKNTISYSGYSGAAEAVSSHLSGTWELPESSKHMTSPTNLQEGVSADNWSSRVKKLWKSLNSVLTNMWEYFRSRAFTEKRKSLVQRLHKVPKVKSRN